VAAVHGGRRRAADPRLVLGQRSAIRDLRGGARVVLDSGENDDDDDGVSRLILILLYFFLLLLLDAAPPLLMFLVAIIFFLASLPHCLITPRNPSHSTLTLPIIFRPKLRTSPVAGTPRRR